MVCGRTSRSNGPLIKTDRGEAVKKLLAAISTLALACTLSITARATADAPKQLTVPAGDLVSALKSLSQQVDTNLVYEPQQLAGMKTDGVSGKLTAQEAVSKLLHGTGLEVHADQTGAAMRIETHSQAAAKALAQSALP